MKKTKIICSIGPSCYDVDVMEKMARAGMNVARINFSHASLEERTKSLASIKKVRELTGKNIAVLYDTKGPDFRTGNLATDSIALIEGKTIRIVKEDILGTEEKITVNYKAVLDNIEIGNFVLIEDGNMKLECISKEIDGITCKIINGGHLSHRKGVNVPGKKLGIPFLSAVDKEDIIFACENEGDILALSFVDTKENVLEVKELLKQNCREDMLIISKIESRTAIENIDDIIEVSDGIMVARGDLGVEMPMEEIPILQKMIIKKCRRQGKICIVATEMLKSMKQNSRPTRAEATDIANAVLDGTDVVMLSDETTIGEHPVEAVEYMAHICKFTEHNFEYSKKFNKEEDLNITEIIAKSVIKTDKQLKTKLIIVPTTSGYSAKVISNLKPDAYILALCKNEKIARKLALNWGIYTEIVPHFASMDEMIKESTNKAIEFMGLGKGDRIIITGGFNSTHTNSATNFMKIEEI